MPKSEAAKERDRLLAAARRDNALRADVELSALDREARAEGRLVWLEQEVEKLRSARDVAEQRLAALEARGRGGA